MLEGDTVEGRLFRCELVRAVPTDPAFFCLSETILLAFSPISTNSQRLSISVRHVPKAGYHGPSKVKMIAELRSDLKKRLAPASVTR